MRGLPEFIWLAAVVAVAGTADVARAENAEAIPVNVAHPASQAASSR
jgi:hypothetical protein